MRVNQPTISVRRECLPILILLLTLIMTACGGAYSSTNAGGGGGTGGGGTSGGGSTGTVIADNWQLVPPPTVAPPPVVVEIAAALNLTNSSITGTAYINDNGVCYPPYQGISLSGTIDPQGNISVTSSSLKGQVLTFTGVLDSARSSISLGNYAFTGGCANGESGPLNGVKFKPVTGNYLGNLSSPIGSTAVTANLTQSPSIVGSGPFQVTGTVTYSSPACSEVFTITKSTLAGRYIQLALTAKDGTATDFSGSVDSQASQIGIADYTGGCGGGGFGTLFGP
jgi:hypothetical protein